MTIPTNAMGWIKKSEDPGCLAEPLGVLWTRDTRGVSLESYLKRAVIEVIIKIVSVLSAVFSAIMALLALLLTKSITITLPFILAFIFSTYSYFRK